MRLGNSLCVSINSHWSSDHHYSIAYTSFRLATLTATGRLCTRLQRDEVRAQQLRCLCMASESVVERPKLHDIADDRKHLLDVFVVHHVGTVCEGVAPVNPAVGECEYQPVVLFARVK
eukprot:COSAG06_NODE_2637_length_6533_cov_2.177184_3_plen_118_part_00